MKQEFLEIVLDDSSVTVLDIRIPLETSFQWRRLKDQLFNFSEKMTNYLTALISKKRQSDDKSAKRSFALIINNLNILARSFA